MQQLGVPVELGCVSLDLKAAGPHLVVQYATGDARCLESVQLLVAPGVIHPAGQSNESHSTAWEMLEHTLRHVLAVPGGEPGHSAIPAGASPDQATPSAADVLITPSRL